MAEIVYVLTNEAMPGYVKIGRTRNLEQRLRELYRTPVPLPFECFFAIEVEDSARVEKALHDAFADRRVSPQREFFQVEPARMVKVLELLGRDVTPKNDYVESRDDQRALDKARERRSVFNFALADIPIGAEIEWALDPDIKARVLDNRAIELNGEKTSLSAAARKLLGYRNQVSGTNRWLYEGEILDERRERLEKGEPRLAD